MWDDAANYWLAEKVNYEEGVRDSDRSIKVEERYDHLMTKANLLDAMGNEPPLSKQRGSGGCRLPVSHSFGFGAIVTVDR